MPFISLKIALLKTNIHIFISKKPYISLYITNMYSGIKYKNTYHITKKFSHHLHTVYTHTWQCLVHILHVMYIDVNIILQKNITTSCSRTLAFANANHCIAWLVLVLYQFLFSFIHTHSVYLCSTNIVS